MSLPFSNSAMVTAELEKIDHVVCKGDGTSPPPAYGLQSFVGVLCSARLVDPGCEFRLDG